jgi:hypothetical protein
LFEIWGLQLRAPPERQLGLQINEEARSIQWISPRGLIGNFDQIISDLKPGSKQSLDDYHLTFD